MNRRIVAVACCAAAVAGVLWVPTLAFDPQPEPPAFGVISIRVREVLQLHAVCSPMGAGLVGPRACAGTMMVTDRSGTVLAKQDYRLRPGQAATLHYLADAADAAFGDGSVRVGIVPCFVPNPLSGRTIPTAELVDETGRTVVHVNPAAPRLSFIDALVATR
jgi:hypothetical protein